MSNFQNMFLGPLSVDACVYYYILTVIFLFLLIISLLAGIAMAIKNPSVINFKNGIKSVVLFFNIFLAYFINRLLYTMCNKSLA